MLERAPETKPDVVVPLGSLGLPATRSVQRYLTPPPPFSDVAGAGDGILRPHSGFIGVCRG